MNNKNQSLEQNENKELTSKETNNKPKRKTNYVAIVVAFSITIFIAMTVWGTLALESESDERKREHINYNRELFKNIFRNNKSSYDENLEEEKETETINKEKYKITNKKTADDVKENDAEKAQEFQNMIKEKLGEATIIESFTDIYYNDSYKLSEINDSVKLREVARYMIYNKDYSLQLTDEEKQKQYNYKISLSKLMELYEKVYGQTIEINDDLLRNVEYPIENKKEGIMTGTWLNCPAFDKIENDNVYFNYRCGESAPHSIYYLTYDFIEQDDTIEIYEAVAYTKSFSEDKIHYTEVYTNSDYSENSLYDTFIEEEDGKFHLNELNKDKFHHYKTTYRKNEKGNYIFEQIELIK